MSKGNGSIILDTGLGQGDIEIKPGIANFRLWDDNSSHYYRFVTGDRTANYDLTLPPASGTVLVTHSTVNTTGYFYTGTTNPTGTTRLNYSGYFYPTFINLIGSSDTTTAATHYFVETGSDGFVRPKTLANARAEIGALTAGDALVGPLRYNSTTSTNGQFYGGTTNPTGITRLNYGGYFYSTRLYGDLISTTANITTLNVVTINGDGDILDVYGSLGILLNGPVYVGSGTKAEIYTDKSNAEIFLNASDVQIGSTTGNTTIRNNLIVSGNIRTTTANITTANVTTIAFSDGTSMNTAASGTGGGASITWTRKTANYTAVNGDRIIADTSNGSFVITLPSTPTLGHVIVIADGNNWAANTLNVARNGATIEGFSEDLQLDIAGIRVDLVYDGTTWEAYTFASPQTSVNDDNTTNTTQYVSMARQTTGPFTNSYVSSTKLYFNPSNGSLNATDFNSLSDATLKENITNITNATDIIDNIRPVSFNWKDNNKKSYGVIAQEIEKVLPNLVETNGDNNIKSVSYTQLVPILLQSIKELKEEVEKLKKRKK